MSIVSAYTNTYLEIFRTLLKDELERIDQSIVELNEKFLRCISHRGNSSDDL